MNYFNHLLPIPSPESASYCETLYTVGYDSCYYRRNEDRRNGDFQVISMIKVRQTYLDLLSTL